MDTLENLSETSEKVLQFAKREAQNAGRKAVGTEHILVGLLQENRSMAHQLLGHFGLDADKVRGVIEEIYPQTERHECENPDLTPGSKAILSLSAQHAKERDSAQIEPEHILLALIQEDAGLAARVLERLQIDINRIENCIPGGAVSRQFATHEDFKKAMNIVSLLRSDVLLRHKGIIGKTRDEIIERLGEPDKSAQQMLEYRCHFRGDTNGSTKLVVFLTDNVAVQYNLLREA